MTTTKMGIKLRGNVKIVNVSTGEVLLDKDNAIHVQNMARIIARGLSHEDNDTIFRIAYGTGGTFKDELNNVVFNSPNSGDNGAVWESRLYHEVYSEIVDDTDTKFLTDPGSAGLDNIRNGGGTYIDFIGDHGGDPPGGGVHSAEIEKKSKVTILAYINENEPVGLDPFTFDELGLYSPGAVAINTAATASVNVGGKLSTDDVTPALSPLTNYGIQLNVDGFIRTGILKTPSGGSGTLGAFTYGDVVEGINSGVWYNGGDNLSDYALFFITDLTGGVYPTITGMETAGFLTAQSNVTGDSSSIEFIELDPIVGHDNLMYLLGGSQWSTLNVNLFNGQTAGDRNNPVNTSRERERLLSHLIFAPITTQKGELLRIVYTITIGVVGDTSSNTTELPPIET